MKPRLITGIHSVQVALQLAQENRLKILEGGQIASRKLEGLKVVGEKDIDQMCRRFGLPSDFHHQGVYCTIEQEQIDLSDLEPDARRPVLLLAGLEDVQNLGNILRTAAFFDVQAVVVPNTKNARLNPGAERIAAGGSMLVPIIEVSNIRMAMSKLKEKGFWITGLAEEGKGTSKVFADKNTAFALVIGNEHEGLTLHEKKDCDFLICLKASNEFSTLNAATSVAVALTSLLGA